jgi:hypothetical protein
METITPTLTVGYVDNSFYISEWTMTGNLVQVYGTSFIDKKLLIKALRAKCLENNKGFIGENRLTTYDDRFYFYTEILEEPKQKVGFD